MTPVFGSAKPLASLSSGLLARKGQAKPAMRPQGFGQFGQSAAAALDDLGWNDMGSHEPVPLPPTPVLVSPPPEPVEPVPAPPVVAMREALIERMETPADEAPAEPIALRPVSVATAARIGRESAKQTAKGKAAFTLRLDSERHLRLRIASALAGRSAQAIVTDAVDAFLRTVPEVDALIAQLPESKRRRQGDGV